MRYNSTEDLPETIQSTLPIEAQQLYLETYNQALQQDEIQPQGELSNDSMAHQIAWQEVEREFVKDAGTGQWHRRGEPIEQEEKQGIMDRIRNLF